MVLIASALALGVPRAVSDTVPIRVADTRADGRIRVADTRSDADGRWRVGDTAAARAMIVRLAGQRVRWQEGVLAIEDVAGEGRPWIGVVERRGEALWLVGEVALRMTGPLARPRLAGPGYLVWATGERVGDTLAVRRLGVLAPAHLYMGAR